MNLFGSAGHDPHLEMRRVLAYGRHSSYNGQVRVRISERPEGYVAQHAADHATLFVSVDEIAWALDDPYSLAGYRVAQARQAHEARTNRSKFASAVGVAR